MSGRGEGGSARWAPYLVAVLAAVASVLSLMPRPASGAPARTADYVIIAGAAGLRWDDVNPTDTPTVWKLAGSGSIGALSVRSAHRPTCPGDGWLTVGAGTYAARTSGRVDGACPPLAVGLDHPGAGGAFLSDAERQRIVSLNRDLPWGAQPGVLAESVRCTTTIGPGAALAAARPFGRIDWYSDTLPDHPAELLAGCMMSIVDLGTVAGDRAARRAAARAVDARLAQVVAARPPRSLLLLAGVSDSGTDARLHVALAQGPGYTGGLLTSPSTGRAGYLQLTDLAPTTLAALRRPTPSTLFVGSPAVVAGGRPASLTAAVRRLDDADRKVVVQRPMAGRFFTVLALFQLALFVAAIPLLRRARRPAGPVAPVPNPPWFERGVEVLLVAAALAVPGALVAGLVPWWRTPVPEVLFGIVTLAVVGAATAAVTVVGTRRRVLGPLGGVAGLVAVVMAADVLTGSRLQLNSVVGYSAAAGGQFAGLAAVGFGVFTAGALVAAGCVAQHVVRQWRPVVFAVIGGTAVLVAGSPYLGADAAGAVGLTAGVCVAAAMSTGGWLTFPRIAWALLAGIAVTSAFALLDMHRPVSQRGSVGRFLSHLGDGTGRLVLHPIESDNVVATATSPLTLLVFGAAVMLFFALLRPWGGLKRLFGLYPAVRASLAGTAVATVIAGLLQGAGLTTAGGATTTVLPLAVLAALRVQRHADERTPAVTVDPTGATVAEGGEPAAGGGEPAAGGEPTPGGGRPATRPGAPEIAPA
ncbi:hypothetical protein HC031_19140 [Planosporangium thailandense]|uniref:Uncharacterized protein n=1 Tax=Planosporangium thailandense TaxID=765197 RepID=A0ABX0Y0F3_9ACTN|nr:hypothetical protein [Planosporangium thailandense]NJC71819.1 hypothetical protein [Planosporangium thailandense]